MKMKKIEENESDENTPRLFETDLFLHEIKRKR